MRKRERESVKGREGGRETEGRSQLLTRLIKPCSDLPSNQSAFSRGDVDPTTMYAIGRFVLKETSPRFRPSSSIYRIADVNLSYYSGNSVYGHKPSQRRHFEGTTSKARKRTALLDRET